MPTPLGLYIHIPFCLSKCAYCDFYSQCADKGEYRKYTKTLANHILEAKMRASDYVVDTIYFGGGTPTAIGERNLIKILKAARKSFKIARDYEITVEANPNSVTCPMLKKLRRAGVNRISFGMQSSNEKELSALGRTHSLSDVRAAVENARRAKIENISLDLMYGIPYQTKESFLLSIEEAIAMSPTHISCYSLKLEEKTPLYERQDEYPFPSDDDEADMYLAAVEKIREAGYVQYEISNFAKDGYHSRHNMRYWTLSDYWGFGPSAHSLIGKKRFSYVRDREKYIKGLSNGDEIIDKIEEISRSERCGEYLMLGLRTTSGIEGKAFERTYRISFDEIEKVLEGYLGTGHCETDGAKWNLTPEGFLISNTIICDVLDALEKSEKITTGYKRKEEVK